MVESANAALMDKIQDGTWDVAARDFGRLVKAMCDMGDALNCEIDVEEYPRLMYEVAMRVGYTIGKH
jgi:hypothetical protein